jgi:hypothetical protein
LRERVSSDRSSGVSSTLRASCWVMVLPPETISPSLRL